MNTVEAHNLEKSFREHKVLKGLTISVRPGEIVSLLGHNGAGKTTAIRILSTLLKFDSGELLLFGEDPYKKLNPIRQRIGYVGQDTERSAYARLTVAENLLFFGQLMGLDSKETMKRICFLSKAFAFDNKLSEQFMNLSGGQKQTVIIMRALLHEPELIFLDEPNKGLDPVMARRLRIFLKDYARSQGKSMFITSHILSEIEEMADRVAFMKTGNILFMDTPENACTLIGCKDIIEMRSETLNRELEMILQDKTDIRLINKTTDNKLIYGTNDFFKFTDCIRDLSKNAGLAPTEFLHRKANLEDAYLYFTEAELNQNMRSDFNE